MLVVQAQPQQQRADRVFHFYHPETTFLKKTIQLPLSEGPPSRSLSLSQLCDPLLVNTRRVQYEVGSAFIGGGVCLL